MCLLESLSTPESVASVAASFFTLMQTGASSQYINATDAHTCSERGFLSLKFPSAADWQRVLQATTPQTAVAWSNIALKQRRKNH